VKYRLCKAHGVHDFSSTDALIVESSVAFTTYETGLMNSITEGSLVLILRTTTSFNLN